MDISHVSNPSSSMSPQPDYQVFLSFRGPDTRRNYADFLYTSLTDVGIRVFRDEEELEIGNEINPQLIQAIELSKISIPVISEKYASSKSCLIELDQMVKSMDNKNRIIIPIFYYVKPKDVRDCTGPFKMALNGHKKRGRDDSILNPWKSALQRIGCLTGYHLHENQEKKHGGVIKLIVREVEQKLKTRDLIVPKQLVGVNPLVQEIMAKLKVDYCDGQAVEIGDTCEKVLIHGIPGIGKTVLAKCLYNKLNHLFDACSFLEKNQAAISDHGITSVQNRLISNLHKGFAQKFDCSDHALKHIEDRFGVMKVLLLLDDVKDQEQLSALVGELDWLAPGSMVIVTSRRSDVFQKVNNAEKYVLGSMKEDKALTLFCKHAFNKDSPPEDFEKLATDIVAAADGLPLALEKVGGYLFGKSRRVWMEKWNLLKEAPDKGVQEAFLESYTTLDKNARQIFLDIACFFNGMDKRIPHYMWDHCEYCPCMSIISLLVRSLVEIGEDKKLCMRGMLKTFGREIVKSEIKNEPCQRSRLWNHEEALDVLIGRKGTEKVEALRLKFADRSEGNTSFKCDHFDGLQNLRFLKLDQADIRGNFQNHFLRLRWLDWQGSPRIFDIQSELNLNLQNLVILDLSGSQVDGDWRGWELLKKARKLKVLKLTGCVQLTVTPRFPGSMELKRLILEGCSNLAVINPSVSNLTELVSLNVKGCSLLRELPHLGSMIQLKELLLDGTSISRINFQTKRPWKIQMMGINSQIKMFKTLTARNCKELTDLSNLILPLWSLKHLALDNSGIVTFGESIGSLKDLETLSLKNCKGLSNLPNGIGILSSLQFLDLSGTEIRTLPESIGLLEKLNTLSLNNCQRLFNLSDGIGNLRSLQLLDLSNTVIQELPPSLENLKTMKVLRMRGTSIQNFPQAILHLQKLEEVDFSSCQSLEGIIPSNICKLSSLVILKLSDTRISGLPQSISCLSRLRELHIPRRDNLQGVPELPHSVDVFYDMGN